MSTDHKFSAPFPRQRKAAGVALVVTLSLLVLVAVAVVAFFSRTTTNQQITSGSSAGVVTTAFADGATQEIIAGLQKEMWDLSGYSQSTNPVPVGVFPIRPLPSSVATNRIQGIVPTIMVGRNVPSFPVDSTTTRDPNATYAQFANLIKQSYNGVPTYKGIAGSGTSTTASVAGPTVTGAMNASNVLTTSPAADGRSHDGTFWNQPQLTSVPSTDATDLGYLVPDWVYITREGKHPTTYDATQKPSVTGALSPTSIVGRYAYNIYDIGGLLNANVAGFSTEANTVPDYSNKDKMIIPGYKGSVLMADLTGLNMGGTLTVNGANGNTFANTSAQNILPNFRYKRGTQSWATDLPKLFASGQYNGWFQSFLPSLDPNNISVSTAPKPDAASPLTNGSFTSRQDLINWVNLQLGGGTQSAAWALPYLTHFSYDLDSPTFTPDPTRPRSNASLGTAGGNDSSSSLDDIINPAFTSVVDSNGNPLIKHRFPLSALSLLDGIYPGHVPSDLLNPNSALSQQIQYDFGLVWNAQYNCWDYKDADQDRGSIKYLPTANNISNVVQKRSPNFFELLKAAIAAGSLGKQRGGGNYDGDTDNVLGNPRYSATTYQIFQIGANIISQSTSNYFPIAICPNGGGNVPAIYGDKDLPYFYRSRLLTASVGYFSGKDMRDDGNGSKNSLLAAVLVQPELWNPHAPNLLSTPASGAGYPTAFRVVPRTGNFAPHTALGVTCYFGQNNGQNWATGGKFPYNGTTESNGIMTGDYRPSGGPDIRSQVSYDNTKPDAYIQFTPSSDLMLSGTVPGAFGSFREPCPLAAPAAPTGPAFPPDVGLTSSPVRPTLSAVANAVFDGLPNTAIVNTTAVGNGNAVPARFSVQANTTSLGFLVGYYCAGPRNNTLSTMKNVTGGPMLLDLQYGINGQFYTYDTIQSAFPSNFTEITPPSSTQQTETGVRTDPRTNRWGMAWHNIPYGSGIYGTSASAGTGQYDMQAGRTFTPSSDLSVTNYGTGGTLNVGSAPGWFGALKTSPLQLGWTQTNQISTSNYYQDPDGVVRSGDSAYVAVSGTNGGPTGLPMAMLPTTNSSQSGVAATYDSRPIVLNRPFQSVAELGYTFRDTPWRSLDFFTPESGDAALLDVFCVYGPDPYSIYGPDFYAHKDTSTNEPTGIVAAKVSLNTRQQPVLAALLKGAATTVNGLTALKDAQATAVAQALVQWTTNSTVANNVVAGPLLNPSELVGKYTGSGATGYNGFSSTITSALSSSGSADASVIKGQRECVMHALADAGSTRTWNLLIDLVAQSGRLTTGASKLDNFIVGGERHIWVSVALDRVTGKIIKMQVETVRL